MSREDASQSPPTTPPRERWPEPAPEAPAGAALTAVILEAFRLHDRIQRAAEVLADAGGLSAAHWQVIGGVLDEARPVAGIARRMGLSRQSVQRIADLLVERGLAEYRPNPAHRRAKLLHPTEAGFWAVRRISIEQHPWAARVGARVGEGDLRAGLEVMRRLTAALEEDAAGA